MQKSPGGSERAAYFRSLELEQTRRQLERTEAELIELNQLYGDLLDSESFLYTVVAPDGAVLFMNMGMKIFLGHDNDASTRNQVQSSETSIFEFCLFSQIDALKSLLHDALSTPVAALVPLVRRNGAQVWMDVEFAPTFARDNEAIQITGMDVTELMRSQSSANKPDDKSCEHDDNNHDDHEDNKNKHERESAASNLNFLSQSQTQKIKIERRDSKWPHVLDSCPGLLCCVLDHSGRLVYASQGYRAIAMRLLGHDCVLGTTYPPQRSETDRALHALLSGVMLGGTDGIEVTERRVSSSDSESDYNSANGNESVTWNFTASPIRIENVIVGAALYVSRNTSAPATASAGTQTPTELLEALAVRAAVVNAQGFCRAVNSIFAKSLAKDTTEIVGQRLLDLIPKDAANEEFHKKFLSVLSRALAPLAQNDSADSNQEHTLTARVADRNGELAWLEVKVKPLTSALASSWNCDKAALLTCTDVTELHRTREQLKRALEVDRTTGILNRQGMERLLTQEVERVIRESKQENNTTLSLSLIIMDIDGFRRINAERGYAATDRALKILTESLRSVLDVPVTNADTTNFTDAIGRWGGDEFMVLTHRSASDSLTLANSLRERVSANAELRMTLSIGVAEFKSEIGMDIAGFIAAAFDAMIKAKRDGGNKAVTSETSVGLE